MKSKKLSNNLTFLKEMGRNEMRRKKYKDRKVANIKAASRVCEIETQAHGSVWCRTKLELNWY